MEGVLAIEFVNEDEDVVDTHGKDEEGDNLGNDECHLDTEHGKEADRG